jgi:predicted nucleic acid-binding protein
VQVLNEIANVARRRAHRSWPEINAFLGEIKALLTVLPLTQEMHEGGLMIAERYRLSVYDAMIVAAAVQGGFDTLWTEDMQHGLLVQGRLRVRNPFLA